MDWARHCARCGQSARFCEETRRLDVRLAELGVCLEDLGRKAEADALYPTKEPTP